MNDGRECPGPRRILAILMVLLSMSLFVRAQQSVVIVGSGSTVPAPLYNRLAPEYGKHNSHVQMKYLPVGTSEGIKEISHGTGDFGAGEVPLSAKERADYGLIELPVVIVGIVPIYNLPGVQQLRLSGEVLAEIFLGDIKNWNTAQIAKLNPDIDLPNLPIRVFNRPAGKGSNYVFSEFLSKSSSKFREQVGISASPKWPVGEPADRSSDMADKVKNQSGGIGYAELQYALKGNIPHAAVLNPAGKFVHASEQTLAEACQSIEAPRWNNFSASLTEATSADSFPIASFTWIYLRTKSADYARGAALADFLDWMYTDGQQFAAQEGYASLPPSLLAAVRKKARTLQ